ncbi:MAG: nucleotidyltransferase family protein [Myxococcales bacterium]|nr:nucleotidyltransferase family protein [Myxococcales bacterium]
MRGSAPVVVLGHLLSGRCDPKGVADWPAVAEAARRGRLEAILAHRLGRDLPEALRERADAQRRRVAFAALHLLREREHVLGALVSLAPVILLKGAVLGHLVYPDPTLRSTNDLDLLIPTAAMSASVSALEAIGYVETDLFPSRPVSRAAYHERLLSRELVPGRVRQPVELHTGFAQPFRHRLSADSLFASSVPFAPDGLAVFAPHVRRLGDVDQLIHLAVHLAREQFLSPSKHLFDVHLWFERGVDPAALVARAAETRTKTALYETLRLSAAVFGTAVAPDLLGELSPPRPIAAWLDYWHTPTGHRLVRRPLSMREAQALLMLPLLDDTEGRVAALWHYSRLRVLDRWGGSLSRPPR